MREEGEGARVERLASVGERKERDRIKIIYLVLSPPYTCTGTDKGLVPFEHPRSEFPD